MKLLFLIFILSFQCAATNIHHIFLTTQAETEHKEVTPSLSQCGKLRARQLATLLTYSAIESVYTTTALSAMETANPLAKQNNIPIKVFTEKLLDGVAISVIRETRNILIVADKKTISFIVEFIGNYQFNVADNHNQSVLYQITIIDDQNILNVFKQPLEC